MRTWECPDFLLFFNAFPHFGRVFAGNVYVSPDGKAREMRRQVGKIAVNLEKIVFFSSSISTFFIFSVKKRFLEFFVLRLSMQLRKQLRVVSGVSTILGPDRRARRLWSSWTTLWLLQRHRIPV